jgi:cytochrome c553
MAIAVQRRRSRALALATGAAALAGLWTVSSTAQTLPPTPPKPRPEALPKDLPKALQERLEVCGACHGEGGTSRMENVPSLAGQPALFLTNQLILMREKLRRVEAMEPFVRGLKDDEIVALAKHYAGLTPQAGDETVDQAAVARGAELAERLRCVSCHGPQLEGQEQIPRLIPQRLDYLVKSLTEYRDGKRYGVDTSMNGVMYQVSDRDIRALAHYLGSLR